MAPKKHTFYTHIIDVLKPSIYGLFVNEIYTHFNNNMISQKNKNWKNSIRHALTYKKYFYKTPAPYNKRCRWHFDEYIYNTILYSKKNKKKRRVCDSKYKRQLVNGVIPYNTNQAESDFFEWFTNGNVYLGR